MHEFHDRTKGEIVDSNTQIDENLINKFNIINLFGKETLEDIQEKISRATGLAFVTVDYKGEPITKMTSFTEFCSEIRKNKKAECVCKSSDAFGGIQAAVTQKNCVYFCPCGLLEIAIPIIVRGYYLGGFIGGQVRCLDAPSGVSKLENVIKHSQNYREDKHMLSLFESVQLYDYEKFMSVAELISLIINQLGEKEAYRLMQKNSLKKEVEELNNSKKELEIENALKKNELINLRAQLNPHFLINVLNSISNLAAIEDSPKTNEMIVMFADYLKQSLGSQKSYTNLSDEFENIEKYLKIQKVKYGNLLQYSINMNEKMHYQRIPSHIIMPFVEYAVFYGIATKNNGGKVAVTSYYEGKDVVICISDNGSGFSDEAIAKKFKIYKGGYEGESIQISISNAREKLITLFGEKYDTFIENTEGEGTRSIIRFPIKFEERNV
ncbi:sensor histidine kinase [Clostridium beijerinckii]|uniref:Ligand-binding sensor protein n=1 Tax=Clostridium beijerinckii TaxID=1520 RepID=A0AAX0B962_CLOBE|nr:PocR ligand-binding domain-containing protein [Clostridium beijerinckii]NRT91696.1 ligand-binding sensor protein [Clostridium beijerinckii]NYC71223.1 ligand-binding sensor protein [Clostridium beijerinckii]